MHETRHRGAMSPDAEQAARSLLAEERRITVETGWSTSTAVVTAIRERLLVNMLAATR
ncbi:hypothetical protein ACFQY4_09960 [Catellatospora bangladeshensis]|uniref:Uncharacterized protein n=1 Tax=Catellatospora bangladeshensis TaxID=310355 RepID=A0A8J3NGV8_9ACTN|nr:hypothetical protein [Catellatospora bangladeshensis]GIF79153.1 hypothetical protein Cba03nite_05020 [Catellatospora bangladeshensis]